MNTATLIGGAVLILGLIMAGDAKMFGMKNAAVGISVAAAGGFLALYGLYGNTESGNRAGSGRKVRDHSV
jgi:hypothetical protein